MITIRKSDERGQGGSAWLDSRHTFSFDTYYDPRHMGFRSLRVINEDWIRPGTGFGKHPHRDMEIITYVLEGALSHEDSMGNGSVIRAGDLQRMTAGTGIMHSEFNHSESETVHLLQIWILPERPGLTPGYEQKTFPPAERRNRWQLVASRDGRDGSLRIHQDAMLQLATLETGAKLTYGLDNGRHAWLQIARGMVTLNGRTLDQGDGAPVSDERKLELTALNDAEVLLFDLA